ncbi:MAG: RNA-dependent DNA polymerase [Acidobacteria bacterium]|nr:RNA-dependent DNA polymerase [Acidobacteriota bacterium]
MKRVGGLWEQVSSLRNFFEAAAGKKKRADVARFLLNLEPAVVGLRNQVLSGQYRPGGYHTFQVLDPKPRLISAAPFRDRVVHHALTRVLEPVFERRFTADSYACREGKGTHKAIEQCRRGCRRYDYVLKCDIAKYFPSIDHQILMELLEKVIRCRKTLDLARVIVDGSNEQEEVIAYFPGDHLFTPLERRRGLPLGNQTSQFFANVYLNPLDHFVKRELKTPHYIRYVDDFLLFSNSKDELRLWRRRIVVFLAGLRLRMHPGKSRVYRVQDGVTFLGWRHFRNHARLDRGNVVRFRRRMRDMRKSYRAGVLGPDRIRARVMAWIGHAMHGDTWQLRRRLFRQYHF